MRRYAILILLVLLAGCNLATTDVAMLPATVSNNTRLPPTPTIYRAPAVYVTPGAVVAPTLSGGQPQAQAVNPQPTYTPDNLLTPVPAQDLIENPQPSPTSQNAIEVLVNNILVPAWNFIYTLLLQTVGTLWMFAGARGGFLAQLACCIAPAVIAVGVVVYRFRHWRIRRRRS